MKRIISQYKKSIYEIGLKKEFESLIWDFYVTRSFANSANQKRAVSDFGIKQIPIKEMMTEAGISNENFKILTCTTIRKTMGELDLEVEGKDDKGNKIEVPIDIDTPRICCTQGFTVSEDIKVIPSGSQADSLFTHIRNAFAHGNTYFFDNHFVILEDKDQRKITARICISVDTLVRWIRLIDKEGIVYPSLTDYANIWI